jgi:hypothetical protein
MKIPTQIILIVFVLTGMSVFGQAPPPPPPPDVPAVPIGGNIFVLLLVATIYGIYKIYELKLNKKTPM